ncbi:MAG: hypothetical protein ACXVHB_00715 [Solirubrobacteraceae bacterium]
MDNREIADRLDAFASLLDLGDANPYTARAYRRAAETIRGLAVPVTELVASGKVRDLRGIGSGTRRACGSSWTPGRSGSSQSSSASSRPL